MKLVHRIPRLATIVPLLLPHLDTLDAHFTILLPCRVPLVTGIPEVFKPTISTTDGDVQNKVEVLVKGRRVPASVAPRILETSTITVRERKLAILPEGLVKVRVHDL
jgi:hypothetical protein